MRKFVLLMMLLLFFLTAASGQTTIRITNGEWEPFLSEYSYEYGLASHIVTEAFRLEGITVQWGFFPWKRSFEVAKKGEKWDASAVWWPAEETKKDFLISVPVVKTSFVFFHLKNKDFDWETIDDLEGLKIGITRGYEYGKELMDAMANGDVLFEEVSSDEQNLKKLRSGRIDIFPNDPVVGHAQIRNTFSPEEAALFTNHPKEFEVSTLSLIISKNSPNAEYFLEKFNAGMAKLIESGKIEEMYKDLEQGKYDKQPRKWRR